MFDSLTTETWAYVLIGLIVTSSCFAWVADAVLGRIGFGVVLTSFIAEGGGYGGLVATDWAIRHGHVPMLYNTPIVYFGGALGCVTLLLIVLCLMKRLVYR